MLLKAQEREGGHGEDHEDGQGIRGPGEAMHERIHPGDERSQRQAQGPQQAGPGERGEAQGRASDPGGHGSFRGPGLLNLPRPGSPKS